MKLTLSELSKVALLPLSENELISSLKTLSKNFTQKRDLIGEKTYSEMAVSAYTLFYLPTNFPKLKFVLDCLPGDILKLIQESLFIDVGAGPGTYSLALLDYFKGDLNEEIILVDSSDLMQKQAKKCLDYYYPTHQKIFYKKEIPTLTKEKTKTLFFGNSLNEMGLKKGLELVRKVDPDIFFMIEPGTKEVFSWVLELRREMGRKGYIPIYPCADLNHSCPLEKKLEEDWCHQVLHTQHHSEIERISQKVALDRRRLPFISHVYRKKTELLEPSNKSYRLIRALKETKFSYIWEVCFYDETLKTKRIEVLKKDLSKADKKSMKNIDIGIGLRFSQVKEIDTENWRVKLLND